MFASFASPRHPWRTSHFEIRNQPDETTSRNSAISTKHMVPGLQKPRPCHSHVSLQDIANVPSSMQDVRPRSEQASRSFGWGNLQSLHAAPKAQARRACRHSSFGNGLSHMMIPSTYPNQGVDLHAELRDFFDRHYKAGRLLIGRYRVYGKPVSG